MNKRAIIEQLRQPSTWRGVVLLASALGYSIRPDVGEAIIAVGLAVSGLIGILTMDPPAPAASAPASASPSGSGVDAGAGAG